MISLLVDLRWLCVRRADGWPSLPASDLRQHPTWLDSFTVRCLWRSLCLFCVMLLYSCFFTIHSSVVYCFATRTAYSLSAHVFMARLVDRWQCGFFWRLTILLPSLHNFILYFCLILSLFLSHTPTTQSCSGEPLNHDRSLSESGWCTVDINLR